MEIQEILNNIQKEIHTTIIATVDDKGNPYTCAIDIMLVEDNKLYFLTARGKSFYQRLMNRPYIALTGLKGEDTMSSVAISLQGQVRNIGHNKLAEIFENNEYMKNIYPSLEAREVLEVFEIYSFTGEYFDLSQKPIYRQSFAFQKESHDNNYFVSKSCNGCQKCYDVCPQRYIDISRIPVTIKQEHCLHCGKCKEICPQKAIIQV